MLLVVSSALILLPLLHLIFSGSDPSDDWHYLNRDVFDFLFGASGIWLALFIFVLLRGTHM